jgi:hypothetical protein
MFWITSVGKRLFQRTLSKDFTQNVNNHLKAKT